VFNLSGSEIVVILLLALVVLGPEKLPDALRRAGRTYAELKKMGNSFQAEMKSALDEPMKEMRETADLMRKAADFSGEPGAAPAPSARRATTSAPAVRPATPGPVDEAPPLDEDLVNQTLSGGAPPPPVDADGDDVAARTAQEAPTSEEPVAADESPTT